MKKLLQYLGLAQSPVHNPHQHVFTSNTPKLDMSAFTSWCKELNVSVLAPKNTEFTVVMGNQVKHVKLERLDM